MQKIAELSGVSIATVSRVINDNGRFSEETRKKVLDVIDKYQYKTNAVAKTLRMSKSHTIGIIVPDIGNEFFSTIVHGIESNLFEKGFSTFICNTDKNKEKEKSYIKSLDSKMVDGLVYISGQEEIDDSLLSRDIPTICIDRRPRIKKNLAMVESDHLEGGYLATKHLLERGCENIYVLTKQNNISSVNDRIKGYKEAMEETLHYSNEDLIIKVANDFKFNIEITRKAINTIIKDNKKIDGIFATNDWLALNAVMALNDLNINVPNDVKVVGFDDDTIAKYCKPSLTTIRQDVNSIIEEASDILYKSLIGESTSLLDNHVVIPVSLVTRETT